MRLLLIIVGMTTLILLINAHSTAQVMMTTGVNKRPCTEPMSKEERAECKQKNGIVVEETSRGRREESYKNGVLHGVMRIYDLNGVLEQERHFDHGQYLFDRYFDEQGKPKEGLHKEMYFFANKDKIRAERSYSDGFLQKSVSYFLNGNIDRELHFKDGRRHGDTKYHYESGEVKKVVSWVNGNVVDSMKTYYKDGKLRKEEIMVDGKRDRIKHYDPSGGVIAEYPYLAAHDFEPVVLKEIPFDGVGGVTKFYGDWRISTSQSQGLGRKTNDQFLDTKTEMEFFADGTCEIYSLIKGRRHEPIRKKYRIEDGRLILASDGDSLSMEFVFMDDGLRLALKTENITMVMVRY